MILSTFVWLSALFIAIQAATGGNFCGTNLCVNAVVSGNSVTYQLVSELGFSQLGWMAVGFGTKMVNSPMVITWPNPDGSVTISQREATAHVMPTVITNPTAVATFVSANTNLGSNSTSIAFTYPLPSTSPNAVPMIWAYSGTRPSSSAVDATIVQHDKMGTATMDLTQTVGDLSGGSSPSGTQVTSPTQTSNADNGLTSSEQTIRRHAILTSVGFLVCLPLGIFIARFSRTIALVKDKWFTAHWFVQLIVSCPIIATGWFTGYNYVGAPHFQDTHARVGLVLLVLYIFQMLLGTIIHFFKPKRKPLPPLTHWDREKASATKLQPISQPKGLSAPSTQSYPPTQITPSTAALVGGGADPRREPSAHETIVPAITGRPIQNYAHALLGLFIILLAFYNVHRGYDEEWLGEFGSRVNQVPFLAHLRSWWISWIIIIPLIYAAGLSLLPKQWRQETNARRTGPPE